MSKGSDLTFAPRDEDAEEDPHTVMHVYEGDGGVIIRDGGNISTFGVQSSAVMAAFDAASEEPGPEHHAIADLAARLAKAERAPRDKRRDVPRFARDVHHGEEARRVDRRADRGRDRAFDFGDQHGA